MKAGQDNVIGGVHLNLGKKAQNKVYN